MHEHCQPLAPGHALIPIPLKLETMDRFISVSSQFRSEIEGSPRKNVDFVAQVTYVGTFCLNFLTYKMGLVIPTFQSYGSSLLCENGLEPSTQ